MKFCKKYKEYMQEQEKSMLPRVGFKKLKKILKKCRRDFASQADFSAALDLHRNLPPQCSVCDGTFFPALMRDMSDVVGCFNERAQKLLELHLSSGFGRYFTWFKSKRSMDHLGLLQEGRDLVTYALINSAAVRKILKKYDKVHDSRKGQAFKTQVQKMHIKILQSPWLCELMAFQINMRESQKRSGALGMPLAALLKGCTLTFNDEKPSLSCELFDSFNVDIDLTCSVCLETVFDPVSLTCGHIFCYMCACSAAAVSIVDGLKAAEPTEKCPLCREVQVHKDAVRLDELNILLRRSCREYWEERRRRESAERVKQAREYWDYRCRSFMGI